MRHHNDVKVTLSKCHSAKVSSTPVCNSLVAIVTLCCHLIYNSTGACHTVYARLLSSYKWDVTWNSYNWNVLFSQTWKFSNNLSNHSSINSSSQCNIYLSTYPRCQCPLIVCVYVCVCFPAKGSIPVRWNRFLYTIFFWTLDHRLVTTVDVAFTFLSPLSCLLVYAWRSHISLKVSSSIVS